MTQLIPLSTAPFNLLRKLQLVASHRKDKSSLELFQNINQQPWNWCQVIKCVYTCEWTLISEDEAVQMKHVATNSTVCSTDWQLVSNRGNPSMSLRDGHLICVTHFSPCALSSATVSSLILIKRTTVCQNLRYFIIHFVILLYFILKEQGWVDAMEEIVYDAQLFVVV